MATADEYATWIVKNADKRGTPEFDTVAAAYKDAKGGAPAVAATAAPSHWDEFVEGLKSSPVTQAGLGAIRGAAGIGATIMQPFQALEDKLTGGAANKDTRAGIEGGTAALGGDTHSVAFQSGKLGAEFAGTAGVGGVIAAPVKLLARSAPAVAPLANAIETAGFSTGRPNALSRAADIGTRSVGGAINGAASTALVDPDSATTGGVVGGLIPGAAKVAGGAGNAIGKAIRGAGASPEVAALAKRAKELGIDIPADRLVDSKPLNAIASALNYVPFSGRAATESRMEAQLNTAASKLMGQDTPNMTKAIRDASKDLGAKFDATLQSTSVAFDQQLLQDVSRVYNTAEKELGSDALKPIAAQLDELVAKGASGTIDGQAAYNIKRALDRIGSGNTPTAYHALELKGVLMDALNRSLGPTEAAAFKTTREQYGNMLALEKIAKNGAEGDISVARLANLKNIKNDGLQELADIAAQFVKSREGQHGAMQRAVVGAVTAATGGIPGLAAGAGLGRAANMGLNSRAARSIALGEPNALQALANPSLRQVGYRSAPVLASDR